MQKKVDMAKIKSILSNTVFICLLINILLFPVVSHLSFGPVRIVTNIFEYGFCLLTIVLFVSKIATENFKFIKSDIFLILLFIYSTFSFLLFSKKNIESFSLLIKVFVCLCFYLTARFEINNRARLKILLLTIIISIVLLFISSIVYNLKTPENLIQAFSGGRYRLGNLESQANGYASYCFYLSVVFVLIYGYTGKKVYLLLPVIPSIICIGTQSKKGMLICFAATAFSLFLLVRSIKNKTLKNILFVGVPCAIFAAIIIVTFKTNLVDRFFQERDDSTITRLMMYRYLFRDFDVSFLAGKGTNSFKYFFYLNNGTELVFHSTIGDTLFSYGLIGFIMWSSFIISVFYRSKKNNKKIWIAFMIVIFGCQVLTDLTSIIWYLPFSFVFLSLLQDNHLFKYPEENKGALISSEDFVWIEI